MHGTKLKIFIRCCSHAHAILIFCTENGTTWACKTTTYGKLKWKRLLWKCWFKFKLFIKQELINPFGSTQSNKTEVIKNNIL